MIGLDTNVVVRYLAQDDPDQSAVASAMIDELTETDPGYLSLVTVVELSWVLRRAYRVDAAGGPSCWKASWTRGRFASTGTRSCERP